MRQVFLSTVVVIFRSSVASITVMLVFLVSFNKQLVSHLLKDYVANNHKHLSTVNTTGVAAVKLFDGI